MVFRLPATIRLSATVVSATVRAAHALQLHAPKHPVAVTAVSVQGATAACLTDMYLLPTIHSRQVAPLRPAHHQNLRSVPHHAARVRSAQVHAVTAVHTRQVPAATAVRSRQVRTAVPVHSVPAAGVWEVRSTEV